MLEFLYVVIFSLLIPISFYCISLVLAENRRRKKLAWIPEVPGLPIFGNALEFSDTTKFLPNLLRYANKNNGLCRVNLILEQIILASNVEFLEFMHSTQEILDKSDGYKHFHAWLGLGLLTAPGPIWKPRRKLLTPAFHFSILETFVETFEANGDITMKLLEKEVGDNVVDVYPYVTMSTLDNITETAMGVCVQAQTDSQSPYVSAVRELSKIIIERDFSLITKYDVTFPLSRDYYRQNKCIDTVHSQTESVIKLRKEERQKRSVEANGKFERVDEPRRKKAFLDLLLEAKTVDGNSLTHEEIRQEVDTFMFEGHDTTASAISFAIYCLANHSEIQANAVAEQKAIFGKDASRPATYRDLQDMKFLELVIKETLRLYPSVPLYGRQPDKDVKYKDGRIIPKGVDILMFPFGAHRDPNYFEDPETFNPWRFEKTDSARSPYAYIPFSAGSRNCIGQKFAMLEIKSTISKLLRYYELESAGPAYEPVLVFEIILKSKNGVNIKMKKREWA